MRENRKTKHEGGEYGKGSRPPHRSIVAIQCEPRRYNRFVAIASPSDNGIELELVEGRQGKLPDHQTKTTFNRLQHQDRALVRPGSSTAGHGSELHLTCGLDTVSCLQYCFHLDRQYAGRIFVGPLLFREIIDPCFGTDIVSAQPFSAVRLKYCYL